jgi:hypothetical protein
MFQRINGLETMVKTLPGEKRGLAFESDYLKGEAERLEVTIRTDKGLLQETRSKTEDFEISETRLVHHNWKRTIGNTHGRISEESPRLAQEKSLVEEYSIAVYLAELNHLFLGMYMEKSVFGDADSFLYREFYWRRENVFYDLLKGRTS